MSHVPCFALRRNDPRSSHAHSPPAPRPSQRTSPTGGRWLRVHPLRRRLCVLLTNTRSMPCASQASFWARARSRTPGARRQTTPMHTAPLPPALPQPSRSLLAPFCLQPPQAAAAPSSSIGAHCEVVSTKDAPGAIGPYSQAIQARGARTSPFSKTQRSSERMGAFV